MASLHREGLQLPLTRITRQYSKSVMRDGQAGYIGRLAIGQGCMIGITPGCCRMLLIGDWRKLRGLKMYLDSHRPC